MTTQVTDIAQSTRAGVAPDGRALHVAKSLRDATDVECVILFGSRARGDWTERSDIDLMIIEPEIPELDRRTDIERIAEELAGQTYRSCEYMPVDFVYLTRADYERKSVHTVNHVARFARREGVAMLRNPDDFPDNDATDDPEYSDEPMERRLRIADANMHYQGMHDLLDLGRENKNAVYLAQQTLEHAMKALISAQGHEYLHVHELDRLLAQIRANDANLRWQPASDLKQLSNFAGGNRYGPLQTPVSDYTDAANRATEDLIRIYDEITRLTGEDAWAVPPEGSSDPIQARHR